MSHFYDDMFLENKKRIIINSFFTYKNIYQERKEFQTYKFKYIYNSAILK